LATKGKGYWQGMMTDRYQLFNKITGLWDKYDGTGNFLKSKLSPGPWKNVETRKSRKPPRG
jgi:hypothetical protein